MKKIALTTALAGAMFITPAFADDHKEHGMGVSADAKVNASVGATSPAAIKDDAYVTIAGTVGPITDGDEFMLNYGGGSIKVDTNDAWPNIFKKDANKAAAMLSEGDRVVVTGKMDDNWFTKREIDAYSLRHQSGGKVFDYKSATRMDGAPDTSKWNMTDNKDMDKVHITGTVAEVVNDNRYKVRFGGASKQMIEIDTTGVTDGKGQHFKVGDRVSVTGELDDTLFNKREINVDSIAKI